MEFVAVRFFDDPFYLFYGFLIGILVGFLLQKGRLSYYSVIIGQFLFRDFTMLKIMLWAIVVAGVLMYGVFYWGFIGVLPMEPVLFKSALVGGGLLGIGMALLGYCPASCCAAIGQGSRDALFGVLGMFAGVTFFEIMYPRIIFYFSEKPVRDTVSSLLGVSPWVVFAVLALILLAIRRWPRLS
jgi:hypothetical protein